MKKSTLQIHTKIANDLMYYIYKYVDTEIDLDELSHDFGISKFHMHRIFKKEFGKNIYESIKSIRLQKASSLLLTNPHSTISEIANLCGYSSHASFIKAFKMKFDMTPSTWRQKEHQQCYINIYEELDIKIVKMPKIQVHYIRHIGYDINIKRTWQKLQAWIYSNNIKMYRQIALYHDNPTITSLDKCHYIACISTDEIKKDSSLPTLNIPKGIYAQFDFSGRYGDILKFMHWVYFVWLPKNNYETTTNPAYTIYHKNHFIDDSEIFEVSYYLPIKL
jgi:AraC family transcriptional regulator